MFKMTDVIEGIKLSKACSIKADGDSTESKSLTLEVDFSGSTLQGVFDKALAGVVIQWANGPGRKNWTTWKDHQIVKVKFSSPGKTSVDPVQAIIASAAAEGITVEEYVKREAKKYQS